MEKVLKFIMINILLKNSLIKYINELRGNS